MEESLNQRLYNSIGFVRTIKMMAEKQKDKRIEIDSENLGIILNILKDCKERLGECE